MDSDSGLSSFIEDEEPEEKPNLRSKRKTKQAAQSEYRLQGALKPSRATTYTTQSLYDQIHDSYIDLCPEYQRDVVWGDKKQTALIDSIYRNFYVPPVIFSVKEEEDGSEHRICIDGKQRLTSIQKFMDGLIPYQDAFTGKKYWFKNVPSKGATKLLLPEQLRKTFMHKQIVCVEYTELKFTDEQDLFKRVQQGVALTSSEKLGVISTVRVDFVRDLLNTYVPNGTFGDIPWETKRGVDLAVFSHVVRCIEMWGTSQGQEKTLPSLRIQSLEGWLEGNTEIRPDIRTYTRNTVDLLVKIVSRPKYNQPFSMHKKVAPIEMIFIMLLVFARGILPSSDDRLDKRELSNQISEMRTFVRHRFAGRVSLNDQVGRGLLEFINQMEPKEVKKRKRKWEDMEARPSSGISKASSSSSSRRKVAPPEESPLSSSPPLGSLPRVVSASLSQKQIPK